jgi:hypothetical protein
MMKRIPVFLLLCAGAARAQTPSLATYLSDLFSALATVRAGIANKPQPRIPLGAQLIPASVSWINLQPWCNPASAASCTFNNAGTINAYMDALARLGATTADVSFWLTPMRAAAQYSGPLASDCPNGYSCRSLANYDAMFSHAAANHIKIRIAPIASPDLVTLCGLSAASDEAAIEACLSPLIVAAAARWPQIDSITGLHEPTAMNAAMLGKVMSVADVRTFLKNVSAAVKAAVPAMPFGAAAAGPSFPLSDQAYWNDWISNAAGSLDYVALDVYGNSCDVTTYPSELATFGSMISTARAAGMPVRVNESARPWWCPLGGSPSDNTAYAGCGNILWLTTGADSAWQETFVHWASAAGVSSVSLFSSEPLIWYTASGPDDKCTSGNYTPRLMSQLGGSTPTGLNYARLGQWFNTSVQGRARLSGAPLRISK